MRVGVITVSDRVFQGQRSDESGQVIRRIVTEAGDEVVDHRVVPDELDRIREALLDLVEGLDLDLILTTGGTGLAPRDVTPEATRSVIEKEIPGIAEAMRYFSLAKTPRAMLSRAVAGVCRKTLIVNLPGSAKGVTECLDVVYAQLSHAVSLIRDRPVDH